MNTTESANGPGGRVRVGDKYHRNGNTVEIIAIGPETVTCKCTDKFESHLFVIHFAEFFRLQQKSLEWGAIFEPAPNGKDSP